MNDHSEKKFKKKSPKAKQHKRNIRRMVELEGEEFDSMKYVSSKDMEKFRKR